jgi:hypothetical protein
VKARRGPRRKPPRLDLVLRQHDLSRLWIEDAANFLVKVESSILAGETALAPGLYRALGELLRGR